MVSTLYPKWFFVLPAAAVMGAGAGILWTPQGVYLTHAAANYARDNMQLRESAIGYFTGIFFGVFQGNMIIGSLISSGLMTLLKDKNGVVPPSVIKILLYVYIAIAVVSTIAVGFLGREEPPRGTDIDDGPVKRKTMKETLTSVFNLLRDKRMLLLIAVFFYSGVEQGFIFVNFTGNVITPLMGKESIGWVFAVFGGVNVLSSFGFGKIADRIGPSPIVIIAWLSHAAFLILYFFIYGVQLVSTEWIAENKWFIYVSVGFYSIGDAGWQFFPSTMVGMLFTDDAEAGFANLKFFQSLGNSLMSIFGAYILFEYKVIASFITLCIAIISLVCLNQFVSKIDGKSRTTSITRLEQAELLY